MKLPSYLQVTDKIDIKGKMFELQSSRERAKETARDVKLRIWRRKFQVFKLKHYMIKKCAISGK